MKKSRQVWVAAALAGVALIAGAFLAFRGREVGSGSGDALLGMRPAVGNGFAVVELFTSEGCSSCPPADALVAAVQKADKDLPVYILSFHVDYWDRLGWKDAFSDAAYSDRQKDYARWLHLSSIYTPQVIVNGQTEFVGSDAGALYKAIDNGLAGTPAGKLSLEGVKLSGGRLSWQAHGEANGGGNGLRIIVAAVEHDATTKVMAGENHGKTLSHVQIVRSYKVASLNAKGDASGQLAWPEGITASGGELIAFIQDTGNGKIVAATRSAIGG
ncbi:DUF1223 domain-containing protein [Puia sp.]|uniref:DUF1223 domain-containing protein n=1 Tax=Puia sp. TaxID=2045100 RepID=UPI002F41C121